MLTGVGLTGTGPGEVAATDGFVGNSQREVSQFRAGWGWRMLDEAGNGRGDGGRGISQPMRIAWRGGEGARRSGQRLLKNSPADRV
jgi:hypothetical protein